MMKASLETGATPETAIEDNIESFLMVCMAEESSATGQWVDH
jgi:hypothetical protein